MSFGGGGGGGSSVNRVKAFELEHFGKVRLLTLTLILQMRKQITPPLADDCVRGWNDDRRLDLRRRDVRRLRPEENQPSEAV